MSVLLVFAEPGDPARAMLETVWPGEVMSVTARDLGRPGWRHRVGRPQESQAVAEAHLVPVRDMGGVIVRKSAVLAEDLLHIHPADREFAAAESNAFLVAFLRGLSCPVWNAPTVACLAGPNWRPLQWRRHAMSCGFQVASEGTADRVVTVVGQRCFGAPDSWTRVRARRLAHDAGACLLAIDLASSSSRRPRFVGAHPWVEFELPEVAAEVVAGILAVKA